LRYAGFWRRFVAYIIDMLVLWGVVGGGMWLLVPGFLFIPGPLGAVFLTGVLLLLAAASVVPFLYFWLMTAFLGQTLGKMALGIRVVNRAGQPPGLGWAFLREFFGKFLSSLFFGIGYIWAAFDSDKQAWHDKIAATFVIVGRAPAVSVASGATPPDGPAQTTPAA